MKWLKSINRLSDIITELYDVLIAVQALLQELKDEREKIQSGANQGPNRVVNPRTGKYII